MNIVDEYTKILRHSLRLKKFIREATLTENNKANEMINDETLWLKKELKKTSLKNKWRRWQKDKDTSQRIINLIIKFIASIKSIKS